MAYHTSARASASTSRPALRVGGPAPDFSVMDDEGKTVRLSDYRGRKLVVYFYPKDDTPGCTKEACAFRDWSAEIRKRGAVVLGVSVDSVASHKKFKEKYHLNFPLLSDEHREVVRAYGVWKNKFLYGRTFLGIERSTVVIDEAGKIAAIFPKVRVEGHVEAVLAAL